MTARGMTLHGDWTGVYDYDDRSDAAVPFTASLFDIAGTVWGTSQEPNSFAPGAGDHLLADINGTRSGHEVRFRKTYQGAPAGGDEPVEYAGHVSANGNRIEGRWQISALGLVIGGPFVMNRKPGLDVSAARKATAGEEISA